MAHASSDLFFIRREKHMNMMGPPLLSSHFLFHIPITILVFPNYAAALALAMGSCASLHRNHHLRFPFFLSKSHDYAAAPPPVKDHRTPIDLKSFRSLEDNFFDSRPCFESDCEDDFFSVNGEFTPSHGNTPQKWARKGTGLENGSSRREVITAVEKKKLIDLFEESSRRFNGAIIETAIGVEGTSFGSPGMSPVNSYRSNGGVRFTRARPCCLSTLTSH